MKYSDERIARVDKNGKVTAIRPGTITITAKMGNTVVECIIDVKESWTGTY